MSDMEALVREKAAHELVEAVAGLMQESKSNFKAVQGQMAPLLFGPSALLRPVEALRLILECLDLLLIASMGAAAAEMPPVPSDPVIASMGVDTAGEMELPQVPSTPLTAGMGVAEAEPPQLPSWKLAFNPTSVSHLLIELVVPSTLAKADLRACAASAAQLLERRCLVPANARLAVKVKRFGKRLEQATLELVAWTLDA